jgi:hypothetical protein
MAAALAPFVECVVRYAHRLTDGDVAALVRAGYSEDEIFEAIIVAAAGAADRRLQAARRTMARGLTCACASSTGATTCPPASPSPTGTDTSVRRSICSYKT